MTQNTPLIQEIYRAYTPPLSVVNTVQTLLEAVPSEDIVGLHTIILTNSSGLSRGRRRGKTAMGFRIPTAGGLYYKAKKTHPAQIEIFVDNILNRLPVFAAKNVLFARYFFFSKVLYHEIGHHVHRSKNWSPKNQENFADQYQKRLTRLFFEKNYWYMLPVTKLLRVVYRGIQRYR